MNGNSQFSASSLVLGCSWQCLILNLVVCIPFIGLEKDTLWTIEMLHEQDSILHVKQEKE
jgi:hypothetical protein